ncbi:MAG: ATP-binding protein [Cyclobacteriaceae bacterium]
MLEIRKAPNDKTKLELSMYVMDTYFRGASAKKGIEFGLETLALSEKVGDKKATAKIYNRLGTLYNNIGGQETVALESLFKALDISTKENDKHSLGIVNNNLGNVYRDLSYYSKALEFYIKSLEICEEIKDQEGLAYALKNIGITYELQNWYELALTYHQRALLIRKGLDTPFQTTSSLLNVGISFSNLQMYDSALYYLQKADSIGSQLKVELIDEILLETGKMYLAQNKTSVAIEKFEKALVQSIYFSKFKVAADALFYLSTSNIQTGDLQKAEMWADSLGNLAESIQYPQAFKGYFHANYELSMAKNNELEALRFYKKKADLTDSLYDFYNSEDLIQQRGALDLLEKENEINLEKTRQRYQKYIFIYILTFLTLLILVLSFLIYQKLRDNKLLKAQKMEIAIKNAEINNRNINLETEVKLRTKELLDHNHQLEQFAFMNAHNLRGPVARLLGLGNLLLMPISEDERNDIINKLMHTAQELDLVITDLNRILEVKSGFKQQISEVDLNESINKVQKMLREEINSSGAILKIDFTRINIFNSVAPYIDSILYNLINNSIKYRNPEEQLIINVHSSQEKDRVVIRVKDNGIGIDLEKYSLDIFKLYKRFHTHREGKGMGLFLIKSQVDAMGGTIEVDSMVGEGTTFTIKLPMKHANNMSNKILLSL